MYTIYALVDPRTLHVRYVGMTGNHPVERMLQHWESKNTSNWAKFKWLEELRKIEVKPLVTVLEYVRDRGEAHRRESAWINIGNRVGWLLTNCGESEPDIRLPEVAHFSLLDLIGAPESPCATENNEPPDCIFNATLQPLVVIDSLRSDEPANKWDEVTAAFFVARPELLTGPARGIVDLARAMAEADGGVKPHTAYKGIAHTYYHRFRADVRLPNGGKLGTDPTIGGENA